MKNLAVAQTKEPLLRRKVVYLRIEESIRPFWLKPQEEVPVFLQQAYRLKADTNAVALAFFKYQGSKFPACVKNKDNFQCAFDVDKAISDIIKENYLTPARPITSRLWFNYRRLPAKLRMASAKLLYNRTRRSLKENVFPNWPVDKSVEVLNYLKSLKGELPKDFIWPEGKKFAFCASHDLESVSGFKDLDYLLKIDNSFGLKACWNVVTKLMESYANEIARLKRAGCEIGCHGYNHDNKISFLPEDELCNRLESCVRLIKQYQIKGFRSPSLLRNSKLMHQLAHYFDFDSSYPDTDCFSETAFPNGCCSIRPFFIEGIVELPITMPMDSSMLFMGYNADEMLKVWLQKLKWIKQRGGLALINVHCHPAFSLKSKVYDAYAKVVEKAAADTDCWTAGANEIAAYWRTFNKEGKD